MTEPSALSRRCGPLISHHGSADDGDAAMTAACAIFSQSRKDAAHTLFELPHKKTGKPFFGKHRKTRARSWSSP